MIASHSDSWILVQDEPRVLLLSRIDTPDTTTAEQPVIAFQTTNITLKQIDDKEVTKEPAWLELVSDLPAHPMTTFNIELEVNCRFVEVYADGNYVATLKGVVSNASAGPPLLFCHQLIQRISCLNLRMKFISIKNTGNKVENPQILHVTRLAVIILEEKEEKKLDTAAIAASNMPASTDTSSGDFNPAMLLSMMLQRQNQNPKEQQTLPAMTAPPGQGKVGAGAVGNIDLMQMKALLMADMAHLMDIKLAPLYNRLDCLTNRVEELVALKVNNERKVQESSRNACSPISANMSGNTQRESDGSPIGHNHREEYHDINTGIANKKPDGKIRQSGSSRNIEQFLNEDIEDIQRSTGGLFITVRDMDDNLKTDVAVGKSVFDKRREEAVSEGPFLRTVEDKNKDRSVSKNKENTVISEKAMYSILATSGKMKLAPERAERAIETNVPFQQRNAPLNIASETRSSAVFRQDMTVTENKDEIPSSDGALKADMKDLMRLLRGTPLIHPNKP